MGLMLPDAWRAINDSFEDLGSALEWSLLKLPRFVHWTSLVNVLCSVGNNDNFIGSSLDGFKKAVAHLNLHMKISDVDAIFSQYDSKFAGFIKSRKMQGTVRHHWRYNFGSSDPRRIEHRSYDYTKSTNENYGVDELVFYGKYRDIRRRMDYTYHTNYTKARQLWQDAIISSLFTSASPQKNPYLIYTCGAMGVGKGYVMRYLIANGYFPLKQMVRIDPDYFKTVMPEWLEYVKRDCATAGTFCHRESAFIQEIARKVALSMRKHTLIEGSLRDHVWFRDVFNDINTRFPEYNITIVYVYAPAHIVRERIFKRARETGRNIPDHLIQKSLIECNDSVKFLSNKVDFVIKVNNSGGRIPQVDALEWNDNLGLCKSFLDKSINYEGFQAADHNFGSIAHLCQLEVDYRLAKSSIPNFVKDGSLSLEVELDKEAKPKSLASTQSFVSPNSLLKNIPKASPFTFCIKSKKIEQQKENRLNIVWMKLLFLAGSILHFVMDFNDNIVTVVTELQRKATNHKYHLAVYREMETVGVSSVPVLKKDLRWTHVSFPYFMLNGVLI